MQNANNQLPSQDDKFMRNLANAKDSEESKKSKIMIEEYKELVPQVNLDNIKQLGDQIREKNQNSKNDPLSIIEEEKSQSS